MNNKTYPTIDHYLAEFPENIVEILERIRKIIATSAPEATECIAYNMPSFKLHQKPLVYFASFKNHIGFYALPSGNAAFQQELTKYKTGKGSIQFPLNKEIPYVLIAQIVEFRVIEVIESIHKVKH